MPLRIAVSAARRALPLLCCLVAAFFCFAPAGRAADPALFKTPEYLANAGLGAIKASEAYALGFTGKGVTVGVIDSAFAPGAGEFAGKYPYGLFGNWSVPDNHGIHVSGIIAAARNGIGMHGAAFDAGLMPFSFYYAADGEPLSPGGMNGWRAILERPDVLIVNNSWGVNFHLDSDYENYHDNNFGSDFWNKLLSGPYHKDILETAQAMGRADKLLVMASGNEGHLGPSSTAGLPSAVGLAGTAEAPFSNEAFKNNWISAASFDPHVSRTDPRFISEFTNLGQGASAYTIMAPGSAIYSTVSENSFANGYGWSGTSMAAPHVSGVAALVQQAFPYMGGKQLADVIFSTADPMNNPGENCPDFFILYEKDYEVYEIENDDDDSFYDYRASEDEIVSEKVTIYHLANTTPFLTDEIKKHYIDTLEISGDMLTQAETVGLSLDEYIALFGHGTLNAHRAVQGPGLFDANRLDEAADLSENEHGGKFALYPVNSKGYDSVWSNDIGQKSVVDDEENTLYCLDVGLRKQGAGMLYLTGANTYQGPTVIEGGGVSLGKAGSAGASLYGSVHVLSGGLFTGNGLVGSSGAGVLDVASGGTLMPGLADEPGSRLSVDGDVANRGATLFVLGQNGLGNELDADGDVVLSGRLAVTGSKGAPIRPYHDYSGLVSAAGNLEVIQTAPARVGPFLSFTPALSGNTLSLVSQTRALDSLPGVPGRINDVNSALEHMFHSLKGNPLQRRLDVLYNGGAEELWDLAASLRGDVQAATLTSLPFQNRLRPLVAGRPLPARRGAMDRGMDRGADAADNPDRIVLAAGPDSRAGASLWMRPVFGYDHVDGQSGIRQKSLTNRMVGLAAGLEFAQEKSRVGVLAAVGQSDLDQGRGKADIYDVRLGLYGGWTPGAFSLEGLASVGWQSYHTSRVIDAPQEEERLTSRFTGYSAGLGLEAAYDVLHGVSGRFSLSPFAALDADYIRQEGRKESGSELFALDVDSEDYWRVSVNPGLAFAFSPDERVRLSASAGYRRILHGHDPDLDVAFRADTSARFASVGPDAGRDFFTYSLGMEAALPGNVTASARFFGEESGNSSHCGGFLNMTFAW